ncbi:carotenoid ester lipase precursor [Daedaleopsis nitida]|nr:carotenoid ester lipase precursor [Daedaleopsis nitida]
MLLAAFLLGAVPVARLVHGYALTGRAADSSVQLDQAAVVGTIDGAVESFLGIPFAQPPVGDLRLRLPQLLTSYQGTVDATAFGNQCIQQPLLFPPDVPVEILQDIAPLVSLFAANADVPQSEDCLYLNVIRPANTSADARLPVLVWIYGGAFTIGSNAMQVLSSWLAYDGTAIVQRSIDIGEPVIYIAVNYRLNVFGFLGGKEVKEAGIGNLGLQDQRTGLHWVQKFISAFGGDPTKVTIWGESAGAISVSLQMLTNGGNTEGLFRAGIMSSGSPVPTGDITEIQSTYDFVVDQVGCSGSSNTLACLRTVSSDDLLKAANNTPSAVSFAGLATPYMPRADGVFITEPPQKLAVEGKLAKVPFITGDVIDEATLFSIGSLNVTTDAEFTDFLTQVWFPGASPADVSPVLALYPSDPAAGSPFNTGTANAFSPQFKRIAAVQGDWFFNAPRRQLLTRYSSTQATYTFLSARGNFPGLGDVHGSDLLTAYGPGDMTDYFVRFVNDLDPNGASGVQWPKFSPATRQALQFNDGDPTLEVVPDIARLNGTAALFGLSLKFPF